MKTALQTRLFLHGARASILFLSQFRKACEPTPIKGFSTSATAGIAIDCGENRFINRVRERVTAWRRGGYHAITPITRQLLEHWNDPDRENRLFFCQIEAVETAIYITEVAKKDGAAWIENEIRDANAKANPHLFRVACKMATGAGKTVVMAMLIAWHTLNKVANRQDRKFSDTFLMVTPGITIRDRLRVLYPNDSENYYDKRDIVPLDRRDELAQANIVITNYHTFFTAKREEGF